MRLLEFLDHPHIPEPPQVVIEAARIPDAVAKLECKRLWRVFTEDIAHTHRESGVIQDILPARHGVRNRRRFLLLAYHFLATLGSRHVRSTSARLYAERREFFIEEFNKLLDDRFVLQIPEAGLHFVAWLRRESDFTRVARASAEIGIRPSALSFFFIEAKLNPAFVFGFAAWTPAQIRESLVKLATALKGRFSSAPGWLRPAGF